MMRKTLPVLFAICFLGCGEPASQTKSQPASSGNGNQAKIESLRFKITQLQRDEEKAEQSRKDNRASYMKIANNKDLDLKTRNDWLKAQDSGEKMIDERLSDIRKQIKAAKDELARLEK